VPSGSRRLCSARLSGASSSQNVAFTRAGAPVSANSRHTWCSLGLAVLGEPADVLLLLVVRRGVLALAEVADAAGRVRVRLVLLAGGEAPDVVRVERVLLPVEALAVVAAVDAFVRHARLLARRSSTRVVPGDDASASSST